MTSTVQPLAGKESNSIPLSDLQETSVTALTTYMHHTHRGPLFAGVSEQQFVGTQFFSC